MSPSTQAKGPLYGVRVVEMTSNGAGPLTGQILGDLGAEIIKIEPLQGETTRLMPPFKKEQSAQFQFWNRNKKSIAVDLKRSEGLAIAKSLIAQADVFLENARAGVAAALGLGYEPLKAENARLIYLSINGYGSAGPYSKQGAFDHVIQALTGFMGLQGVGGTPEPIRNAVVDKITGIYGAMAILAALFARSQPGGTGQEISVTMLNAYSNFILPEFMARYTFPDTEVPPSISDFYHMLEASDGYLLGLIQKQHFAPACAAFDRTDLLDDPRFATHSLVMANARDLMAELSKTTCTMPKAEVFKQALKYGLPLAPVNTIEEFFNDPQVIYNKCYTDFEDAELGPMRMLSPFAYFSKTPAAIYARAPKLGEHNDELVERCGFNRADLRKLRDAKIIL